jgi:hypothetical protein
LYDCNLAKLMPAEKGPGIVRYSERLISAARATEGDARVQGVSIANESDQVT